MTVSVSKDQGKGQGKGRGKGRVRVTGRPASFFRLCFEAWKPGCLVLLFQACRILCCWSGLSSFASTNSSGVQTCTYVFGLYPRSPVLSNPIIPLTDEPDLNSLGPLQQFAALRMPSRASLFYAPQSPSMNLPPTRSADDTSGRRRITAPTTTARFQ